MNKLFTFFAIFIIYNSTLFSQSTILVSNDSTIVWNENYKLSWNDFKISKNENLQFQDHNSHAASSTEILVHYKSVNGENKLLVYSLFHKYESYVVMKTPNLLLHEQGHFDISELFSRKLRKEYSSLDEINAQNLNSVYDKVKQSLKEYQNLYDLETNSSINEINQNEWGIRLKQELLEYEDYTFDKFL